MLLLFLLLQHSIGLLEFLNFLCKSVQPNVMTQLGRAAADDRIELLDLSDDAIEFVALLIHSLLKMSQLCTVSIDLLVLTTAAMLQLQR
jgi:hypothetical protein